MCYGKEKQYWFIDQEVLYKNLDEEKTHMPKYIISQKTSEAQQKMWALFKILLEWRPATGVQRCEC